MTLSIQTSPQSFPEVLGYRLTEQLYLGSRTAVYRAIQTATQQPVVIKVLLRDYPTFGELVQFRNQYTITKNLPIPGIVRLLSLESLGSRYVLVMEDWGGMALSQYIQQQSLDLTTVLAIALHLAEILHDLGQHRVVHKDIKPANILIQPESKQVKLIDFSIASLLPKETQEIQSANTLEGTLAYLAPEQTGRMNRGIDYRTDFYALGVTLYQLLSGKLPFESEDPLELVHCHIAKVPLPVNQVNPAVPGMVAAIVGKLMAKNAEDRYQSAIGLKHDLEACLNQWKTSGEIAEFELGQRDVSDRFLIPEKLYGRESEVQTLLDAFDRVAAGRSELMLVAGFSGIGKTAVVNEVHKPIVRQRGYFIKGKFDQFNRNIPLSAFAQALRDLMRQLLSESDAELAAWKSKILAVVGENGQVLIDVMPELEQIIGQQPAAPALTGSAAQNRFNLLFQKFIEVFTTVDHPLVMFLDDLQWADVASLQLLKLLMKDNGYLLMLGAYRDNEVSPTHPLMLMVEEIQKSTAIVHTITLKPLAFSTTNRLIADTLNCSIELAKPLTELVDRKTKGNPFFTAQFLKALYEEGYIRFNRELRYWECDITQVTALSLTDDVVEFMATQLRKLSDETQQVLKLAACIGNQFDLTTLAMVLQQPVAEAATVLWKALQEGLILPTSQVYKFFQAGEQIAAQSSINPTYRFLHDRVQQAAYSLIPTEQRETYHLQIGRSLLQNLSIEQQADHLFNLVSQLNAGKALITDEAEREELAQLNLKAAQKAIAATAYDAAKQYLHHFQELLKPDRWKTQYELTLSGYITMAEVAYLLGDLSQMEALADLICQQAKTFLDTTEVCEIKIEAYSNQGDFAKAINIGLEFLKYFGIEFPSQPTEQDFAAYLGETQRQLAGRSADEIVQLPVMTCPDSNIILRILMHLSNPTYVAQPALYPLVVFKQVQLSATKGNAAASTFGYSVYGLLLCGVLGDIELGYQLGEVVQQLSERFNSQEHLPKTQVIINHFVNHWKRSLTSTLEGLKTAHTIGIETGDLTYAGYGGFMYCFHTFLAGRELTDLHSELATYDAVLESIEQKTALRYLRIIRQTIANFLGEATDPIELTAIQGEQAVAQALEAEQDQTGLWHLRNCQTILSYLFGDFEQAKLRVEQAYSHAAGGVGMPTVPILCWYEALTHLAILATKGANLSQAEQAEYWQAIETAQAKLQGWASHAPMNCQHRYDLICAETYKLREDWPAAILAYEAAIAGAKANGYVQEEALANELAAKFYLAWDKEKIAAGYMQEAYYCYARWGAQAKIEDLTVCYPHLLQPILQSEATAFNPLETLAVISNSQVSIHSAPTVTQTSHKSFTSINTALDFAAILKSTHALASSIQFDDLLHQLTQIILQNSGADRCVLILPNAEDEWEVRAIATPEDTQLCHAPLQDNPDIPTKLIYYVKNTQEMVLIDDCETELPVMDEYLHQRRPKSILCLPILNQGHLVGILYLKNRLTRDVFTHDRILILNFLCTQAAISLENARLYQQSQEKEAQYRGIFEAVSDGLLVTDLETGKIIDTNPAYHQLHGYSYSEILSLNPLDFIPSDRHDKFDTFLTTVKAGQPFTCEAICKKQDGTPFYIEVTSVPFVYKGKRCGLSVVRNVTERKQMELAIQEKNRTLEQAMTELKYAQMQMIQSEKMSALGNLVAGVAHEINNPIGFLNGSIKNGKDYVEDLLGHLALYQQHYPNPVSPIQDNAEDIDLEFLSEDLPKLLNSMQGATDRISGISTSLRTFSRADTEHKVSANLHDGLDSTILILKYRLKANEHRPAIEVIQEYGNLPLLDCYPGQLNQVFMNILANAIDMFDEMAQTRSFAELAAHPQKITIRTSVDANQVQIQICDNGKGMPEEVKAKIFDHLFTTKGVGKGTGLGLAIARQIVVDKHSGSLTVQSEPSKGTEFCIQLPIVG
ncbi:MULTISPECIES: AAA family ATPase [Leptolyngbya]|uniref:AAA family ATPase n=1 Tax=Leptolyngbya TaxID=47251 RepID=UPI00168748C4|nr:AAA family ATPase [Leptolyngbya sp. FACHB-1624]MBD1855576.1 AAA family ATPase [Leptolyngbya sp. FACHB-1624]